MHRHDPIVDEWPDAEHAGGEGSPLVLLHGLSCGWRIWDPVLAQLQRHHRVIAPTLAGHRGAAPLARGTVAGVPALTDVIEARLDALGIGRAHVAGNSLGGWIALELARRGRARSVVALSPAGAWDPRVGVETLVRRAIAARKALSRLRASEWSLLARPRVRRMLFGIGMHHPELMPAAAAAGMLRDLEGCAAFEAIAAALVRDGPIAGPLDPPDCHVRIAWGQRDRVIPFDPYGRLMLDAVPSAEFVVLPGVGHVPMYDAPSLVAKTILDVTWASSS